MIDFSGLDERSKIFCQACLDRGWILVRVSNNIFKDKSNYYRFIEHFGPRNTGPSYGSWDYPAIGYFAFKNANDALIFKLSWQ